jgi:MFS family permease
MTSASAEWRRYPMLPVAAALGYATSVIHIYGLGPYIGPISESFGWSRTQTTFGLTIATLVQAFFSLPIGLAVDRYGPRLFGVAGILLTCGAFALLGTATGGVGNWYLLWGRARGGDAAGAGDGVDQRGRHPLRSIARAGLCGHPLRRIGGSGGVPAARQLADPRHGWQTALMIQAGIWVAVSWPLIFLFFRGAHDKPRTGAREERRILAGSSLGDGLRSTIYLRLLLASLLFTFTIIALVVHFVPILTDRGADKMAAAGSHR